MEAELFERFINEAQATGAAMQLWGGIITLASMVLGGVFLWLAFKVNDSFLIGGLLCFVCLAIAVSVFILGTEQKHDPTAAVLNSTITVREAMEIDYTKMVKEDSR